MYIHEYTGMSHRRYLDCPIRVDIIKYWIKILNAFKIRIGRTLKNMLKVKKYQHHHQHQLGLAINCFKFPFIVDSVISTQTCTSGFLGNIVRTFHIDRIKNNVVFLCDIYFMCIRIKLSPSYPWLWNMIQNKWWF